MSETTIYVSASRAQVRQAIAAIPQGAFGEYGAKAIADAMMTRCGSTTLEYVSDAFIVKARGGTDEAGDRWKPLSPKTIAYSRRNRRVPGDPAESQLFSRAKKMPWIPKQGLRAGYAPSFALTTKQRKRWWEVYKQQLARFKGDKSAAAKIAWSVVKREGATTMMAQFGHLQVDILRSSFALYNTLVPGADSAYQVFRVGRGEVIVGSKIPYAIYHHEGRGHNPQRRLWPLPSKWPSSWWLGIAEQARDGLVEIAILLIRSIGR